MGIDVRTFDPEPLDADGTALYRAYSRRVYGFALNALGSPEEAEEALQDTYLNAWRGLRRGVQPNSPLAWLLTIARNVCISRQRARGAEFAAGAIDDVPNPTPAPPSQNEALFALSSALATLPDTQRRVLVMLEWQGFSYGEVASELGLSYSAVANHALRARKAAAAALAGGLAAPPR